MSEEQIAALLAMLKVDLGIKATAYDNRLTEYIRAADKFITEEGAKLVYDDPQDSQIIVMYAAWLWRKRESGEGMPRMLRLQLNNRVMSRKMRDDG